MERAIGLSLVVIHFHCTLVTCVRQVTTSCPTLWDSMNKANVEWLVVHDRNVIQNWLLTSWQGSQVQMPRPRKLCESYSSPRSSAFSARNRGPMYLTRFIALGHVTSMTQMPTQRLASAGGSITSLNDSTSFDLEVTSTAASCSNGYTWK